MENKKKELECEKCLKELKRIYEIQDALINRLIRLRKFGDWSDLVYQARDSLMKLEFNIEEFSNKEGD